MKTILLKDVSEKSVVIFIDKINYLYGISETHTNIIFDGIDNYINVKININDLVKMIKNLYSL